MALVEYRPLTRILLPTLFWARLSSSSQVIFFLCLNPISDTLCVVLCFFSVHWSWKWNLIHSLCSRVWCICARDTISIEHDKLRKILINNGYSPRVNWEKSEAKTITWKWPQQQGTLPSWTFSYKRQYTWKFEKHTFKVYEKIVLFDLKTTYDIWLINSTIYSIFSSYI